MRKRFSAFRRRRCGWRSFIITWKGKSFLQVGDLLYMDKGTAHRWASRALDALVLPENPIDIFSEDCNGCLSLPTDATPERVL